MKITKYGIFTLLFLISHIIYSEESMDTIVITAELIEETEDSHSRTIISEDEIKALPGASTSEIVANVMGVKLSKFGNDAQPSFISIRGSSPEQVLVLLNGKKLNSSQGGGVDLSIIPPESIKNIEIIRGGDSAVYGGTAFGGIINIITKKVTTSYTSVKYDYSSDSKNELSLNIFKNMKTFKIASNLNLLYTPGTYIFTSRDVSMERENSDIKSLSSSISMETIYNQVEISLAGNLYISDKGVPGIVEFPTYNARINDQQIIGNMGLQYNNLEWDIDYLYKKRVYNNPDVDFGSKESTHDYKSLSTLISYNDLFGIIELSGNYDYLESNTYSDTFVDKKNISLYISPDFYIFNLEIKPSIRLDYNLQENLLFSWSLGFFYNLFDDKIKISGSIGSAYREPSFNDLFWPETSFATGNQELKNENALITDLNLLYQITDSIQIGTTLYYHYISNLIQWNPGANGVWSPQNIGLALIEGLECELTFLLDFLPIAGYMEGRLNYTYLSALNKESGVLYNKKLIGRAAHKGNILLIYYSDLDFNTSIDLSYTGDRYTTSANTKLSPGYLLLDINFSKEIFKRTSLSIYGKNILNIEYEDYRGYPVPGIIFGAALEYRMDNNE